MTVRAIFGLVLFNCCVSVIGSSVLVGIRPSLVRRELFRLIGLAYLLGLSALMVALTFCIVVGFPITLLSIVVVFVLILIVGLSTARYRRRGATATGGEVESGSRGILTVASAVPLGALIVVLESIFRRGRLEGLLEFDGWDSWGPITKDLYFTGHLQPDFLASQPGGTYPPGLSEVLASALHAMGSPDVVTVHLQYWFMALGFATALIGLLSQHVRPGVLMPFVLLVFVMPDIRGRSIDMYGDLPLGYLVASVALLVWLWLEDREHWSLALVTLISAGAILTKREGVLFVACAIAAGALACWSNRRSAWPRLGLSFLISCSGYVVWSIWLRTHQLHGSTGPDAGFAFVTDVRRAWDSALVVTKNVFNFDLWLLATTLAVAAVGLALLAGTRRSAMFVGSFLALATVGATVVVWSTPGIILADVSVVSRIIGTIAISAAALTPVVLQKVLDRRQSQVTGYELDRRVPNGRPGTLVAGAIVVAAAGLYPATVMAKGWPRFPRPSDCVAPAGGNAVRVVFGYANSYPRALQMRDQVRGSGFPSASIEQDGCGRLRVFIPRPLSRTEAEGVARRAMASALTPTLELLP